VTFRRRAESRRTQNAPGKLALSGGAVLDIAAIGGLLAGAYGIFTAPQMNQALDIVLCLFGCVAGCGLVCYFYFRRH